MDNNHLVYRLVCIIGGGITRDLEAEGALTRALARNGGDGLTACNPDAGACPKPCLRHRRVNVGIWPNWRLGQSMLGWREPSRKWPDTSPFVKLRGEPDCGTYQDHLDYEKKKAWLADLVKRHQGGEPVALWNMTGDELARQPPVTWSSEPSRPSWAQNGQERVWWDRNLGSLRSSNQPDTTWYAQYPEQVRNEQSEPQWTVTSPVPRPFEGKTYRFDPISITVPLPVESPQPSASHQSLLAAAIPPPAPDSEA